MSPAPQGTPLPRKLGIAPGSAVLLLQAPRGFEHTLGALPERVVVARGVRGKRLFDVILLFATSRALLERRLTPARERLATAGGLWIAWPKKASGRATELSGDVVRGAGLASGLVDNKVCALDATWSALRFVRRVADRR